MNTLLPTALVVNLFPALLSYSYYIPLVFRLVVGIIFIQQGWRMATGPNMSGAPGTASQKVCGWGMIVASLLVLIGLQTQLGALVLSVFSLFAIFDKVTNRGNTPDRLAYYVVLLVLTASLLVLGAGWLAFDLPF